MAVTLMRQPGRTLAEIGLELGYADQAAFTRAARRWFGEAPASARARL
jgi:AraC-like DNA-binding protein